MTAIVSLEDCVPCPMCDSTGERYPEECPLCYGHGLIIPSCVGVEEDEEEWDDD